jgi:hypothetical protein
MIIFAVKIHKEYINRQKKEFVGFCGRASFFNDVMNPAKTFCYSKEKLPYNTHTQIEEKVR